jgi:hypothetical protein
MVERGAAKAISATAFAVSAGARSGGAESPFGKERNIAGFLREPGKNSGGNRDDAGCYFRKIRSVEPMPPSGSKPADGAVRIYGVHEFHDPPPRFELKTAAL